MGEEKKALQLVEDVGDLRAKVRTLRDIAHTAALSSNSELASSTFATAIHTVKGIDDLITRGGIQRSIARALVSVDHASWGCEVARSIDVSLERARALADIASAMLDSGAVDETIGLLKEALIAAQDIKASIPRIKVIGDVIRGFVSLGEMECARRAIIGCATIIDAMQHDNQKPDAFRHFAQIQYAVGFRSEAGQALRQGIAHARLITAPREKLRALRDLAIEQHKQGYVDQAIELLKEVEGEIDTIVHKAPRHHAWCRLAGSYVIVGRMDLAMAVAARFGGRSSVLLSVVNELIDTEQFEKAEDLLPKIVSPLARQRASRNLSRALAKTHKWETVQSVADVAGHAWDVSRFTYHMLRGLIINDHIELANALLNSLPVQITWTSPELPTFLAIHAARSGTVSDIMMVLDRIRGERVRSKALLSLVSFLADCGRLSEATHFADQVPQYQIRGQAWREIARGYSLKGNHDDALRIVDELSDPANRAEGLRVIAQSMAAGGEMERAIHLLETISIVRTRSYGFGDMVEHLVHSGKLSEATKLLERIENKKAKDQAFSDILKRMIEQGKLGVVQESLEQIGTIWYEMEVRIALGRHLMLTSSHGRSKDELKHLLRLEDETLNPQLGVRALHSLITGTGACLDLDFAADASSKLSELIDRIIPLNDKIASLLEAAECYAVIDHHTDSLYMIECALDVLQAMPDGEHKEVQLRNLLGPIATSRALEFCWADIVWAALFRASEEPYPDSQRWIRALMPVLGAQGATVLLDSCLRLLRIEAWWSDSAGGMADAISSLMQECGI